jgi:hypothetical protein
MMRRGITVRRSPEALLYTLQRVTYFIETRLSERPKALPHLEGGLLGRAVRYSGCPSFSTREVRKERQNHPATGYAGFCVIRELRVSWRRPATTQLLVERSDTADWTEDPRPANVDYAVTRRLQVLREIRLARELLPSVLSHLTFGHPSCPWAGLVPGHPALRHGLWISA